MRLKSAVLGLVATCGVVLAVPSTALAAPAQCSLVTPAKVVVDSRTEQIPVWLSSNCTASGTAAASWDLVHGDAGWEVDFTPEDIASGTTGAFLPYDDTDVRGLYRGYPVVALQADLDPLTQNDPRMQVKNACRVSITGTRATPPMQGYTITVKGSVWSSVAHGFAPRRGGAVQLLEQRADGSWALVDTTHIPSTTSEYPGRTYFWPTGAARGDKFRVVVLETATTWTCGSAVHTVTA